VLAPDWHGEKSHLSIRAPHTAPLVAASCTLVDTTSIGKAAKSLACVPIYVHIHAYARRNTPWCAGSYSQKTLTLLAVRTSTCRKFVPCVLLRSMKEDRGLFLHCCSRMPSVLISTGKMLNEEFQMVLNRHSSTSLPLGVSHGFAVSNARSPQYPLKICYRTSSRMLKTVCDPRCDCFSSASDASVAN
jgi:hypothetical protein